MQSFLPALRSGVTTVVGRKGQQCQQEVGGLRKGARADGPGCRQVRAGSRIHHSVIGLRGLISEGCTVEDTLLMGADYYETLEECALIPGCLPMGLGAPCPAHAASPRGVPHWEGTYQCGVAACLLSLSVPSPVWWHCACAGDAWHSPHLRPGCEDWQQRKAARAMRSSQAWSFAVRSREGAALLCGRVSGLRAAGARPS